MRFLPLIIVFLLLIILSILGFAPNIHVEASDKILHFVGFIILTIAIYFVWDRDIKWNVTVTGILSFSASLISEIIQGFLPYKIFDWQDIVANILGSSLGLAISMFGDWMRKRFSTYENYKQVDSEEGRDFVENVEMDL